jgi:hypothetical protein
MYADLTSPLMMLPADVTQARAEGMAKARERIVDFMVDI